METISIRNFADNDAGPAARLFFDAVHLGTQSHYDEAQRQAWAPRVPEISEWRRRLASQITLVAEQDGTMLGFMTLEPDGYIDLAFVAPGAVRRGVASRLCRAIHAEARRLGIDRLHSQASHPARGFFERHGWSVVNEQTVSRLGVAMTNFVMEKRMP